MYNNLLSCSRDATTLPVPLLPVATARDVMRQTRPDHASEAGHEKM